MPVSKAENPQSFYNDNRGDTKLESELDLERAASGVQEGGATKLDRPLMLALFKAFAEHEESHFLSVFQEQHPKLVEAYRCWQDKNPVLRERAMAA